MFIVVSVARAVGRFQVLASFLFQMDAEAFIAAQPCNFWHTSDGQWLPCIPGDAIDMVMEYHIVNAVFDPDPRQLEPHPDLEIVRLSGAPVFRVAR